VPGPHAAFPLRFRAGRFLTVEEGSPRHLQDQAEVAVRTRPETLDHAPEFGLRDLVGTLGPASPQVAAALERWVPGALRTTEDREALLTRMRNVFVASED
jgi:hypothetical protein